MFSPEHRAVYETMWKNTVKPDKPQMSIQYGAFALHARYLSLQHALIICNTYCFLTATMVTRTRLNVRFICMLPVLFNDKKWIHLKRARGGAVVEVLHYKQEGRGFDSRWCQWIF
jgi:hypothetical protein